MLNLKDFNNKNPSHRLRKEIVVLATIGLLIIPTIYLYTYILYPSFEASELPAIDLLCDNEINDDTYVECIFELDSERIKAEVRLRGDTASKYPKKSYRLQLSTPKALLGMRKDDDWILLSLYNDHQRLNTKLSMDIWRSLDDDNPTAILPKSRYVKLFINGEFYGLYLLAEKEDKSLFKLDEARNNIHSSLIFQAKYWTTLDNYETNSWEQDWPNEEEGIYIMDTILTELISFISNTSDEVFFDPIEGIYSKFEKLNLIDFYLFNYFIQHKDFWSKNYFIVRQTYPSKFFLIPWDFDSSIGGRWGLYDAKENREIIIREKNVLFNRLLNNYEFRQECKIRWIDLRENLWTDDFILDMASDNYEEIKDILGLELRMWGRHNTKEKDIDIGEEVNKLFEWLSDRLAFCDLYFSEI